MIATPVQKISSISEKTARNDRDFLEAISRIKAGTVREEELAHTLTGKWQEIALALLEGMEEKGLEGFKTVFKALKKDSPDLLQKYEAQILHGEKLSEVSREQDLPNFLKLNHRGKTVYKTLSEDDIEGFPDIEHQIEGLLQTVTVAMIVGPSNTGKTFMALDLAEHTARGLNWLGRPVKQGQVLYIYAESKIGLKPRIQAWKKHYNATSTPNLKFITMPVHLVNDKQWLLDTIEDQDAPLAMVVVDTFSNCSLGVDQNSQAEVYKVLATAHEIVRDYGCVVLIVHHENNTGKFNGSAAFKNHVDTMIQMNQADRDEPIIMRCEKQRDAERFNDIVINLQVVELYIDEKTLKPVTSCVVVAGNMPEQTKSVNSTERKMLEILADHGRLSAGDWLDACVKGHITKSSAFYNHARNLVAQNKVRRDGQGIGKTVWYELIVETTPTTP